MDTGHTDLRSLAENQAVNNKNGLLEYPARTRQQYQAREKSKLTLVR